MNLLKLFQGSNKEQELKKEKSIMDSSIELEKALKKSCNSLTDALKADAKKLYRYIKKHAVFNKNR